MGLYSPLPLLSLSLHPAAWYISLFAQQRMHGWLIGLLRQAEVHRQHQSVFQKREFYIGMPRLQGRRRRRCFKPRQSSSPNLFPPSMYPCACVCIYTHSHYSDVCRAGGRPVTAGFPPGAAAAAANDAKAMVWLQFLVCCCWRSTFHCLIF